MDADQIKQCSYNQLKQIALEHGIFKSIKSKKKVVLMEKIIDYLSQKENVLEKTKPVLDNGNKENVPEEVEVPILKNQRRKTRKTKVAISPPLEEKIQSSDRPEEGRVLDTGPESDSINQKTTLEVTDIPVYKGRQRKGRKVKVTRSHTPEETLNSSSDRQDGGRALEDTSLEIDGASKNTPEEPVAPAIKGRQRKGRKAKATKISSSDEALHPSHTSDEDGAVNQSPPETDNKDEDNTPETTDAAPRKGRKRKGAKAKSESSPAKNSKLSDNPVQSSSVMDNGKEKSVVETVNNLEDGPGDSSDDLKRSSRLQSKIPKANLDIVKTALPDGPVPATNRRGTFSVASKDALGSRTAQQSSAFGLGAVGVADRRDTFVVSFDTPSNDRTTRQSKTPAKGAVGVADRRDTFVVSIDTPSNDRTTRQSNTPGKGPVAGADRRDTFVVSLATPSDRTTKQSNTPGKIQKNAASEKRGMFSFSSSKSLINQRTNQSSTPASKLNSTVNFSAKKVPNFAKIHQKNFDKMESIYSYSERKLARRELLSPLNKTCSDLRRKDLLTMKRRSSADCQASKSLIPVRAARIRLDEKRKISAFANKTHVTNVEAIREKDRNFLKGVRTNKRFMLQMKMRKLDV